MTNSVGFRPKLQPPRGRQLQHSNRPFLTCFVVSGCVTVLVGVVFALTAFNIYSHRFGHTEHRYHAGDELSLRHAANDLSSTFCFAYTVQTLGRTSFYLLPQPAELDLSQTVPLTFNLVSVPRRRFVITTHYLLVSSTIRLSACYRSSKDGYQDNGGEHVYPDYDSLTSDPKLSQEHNPSSLAMILVIVGDDHLTEWLKHNNMRHVKFWLPIPDNATCTEPAASLPILALTVSDSSDYHFILMSPSHRPNSHHQHRDSEGMGAGAGHTDLQQPAVIPHMERENTTTLIMTGNLNKTQFNLSSAQDECRPSKTSCSFALEWGSQPDVVARILQDADTLDRQASFMTQCQERMEFWIPVFGGLPALIIVSLWTCCWCLLVKRTDVRSRYHLLESSSVVQTPAQSSYGSVGEQAAPLTSEVPSPEEFDHSVVSENDERCASIQA